MGSAKTRMEPRSAALRHLNLPRTPPAALIAVVQIRRGILPLEEPVRCVAVAAIEGHAPIHGWVASVLVNDLPAKDQVAEGIIDLLDTIGWPSNASREVEFVGFRSGKGFTDKLSVCGCRVLLEPHVAIRICDNVHARSDDAAASAAYVRDRIV